MIKKVSLFLITILLVGFACYVFYYNREPITVAFGPTKQLEAPLAIVLISVFFLGAACVGLIALYVGTKRSLSDWMQQRKEKRARQHEELLLRGRSLLLIKNYSEARQCFSRITQEDPNNALAWVLLSEATEADQGDREALRVLDKARKHNRDSLELLVRASEINEAAGNVTAAYDNLSLLLSTYPDNSFARQALVRYARELSRYPEAIEHLQHLLRSARGEQRADIQAELADIEVLQANAQFADKPDERRRALEDILRRHRNCASALAELGSIAKDAGDVAAASKHFSGAFTQTNDTQFLDEISAMWLASDNPDKAIAAIRSAVLARKEDATVGRLYLAHLYLKLEMLAEAKSELEAIEKDCTLSANQKLFQEFLLAKVLHRDGDVGPAHQKLTTLIEEHKILPDYVSSVDRRHVNGEARGGWRRGRIGTRSKPSPRLSTP